MLRRFISKLAVVATALAAALILTACAGGGDVPTGVKPPPVDTTAKIVSVVASGDPTMVVGATKNYVCVATYDHGPTKDCTAPASWGALPSTVVTVNAGVATALQPGNVQITVTFEGKSYALSVEVKPDPVVAAYNQLTATQKEMVGWFMASNRTLWRPDISQPLKFWVDPKFPSTEIAPAFQNWTNRIGATFTLVADSTQARYKAVFDSTLIGLVINGHEVCALGGIRDIVNDVPTGGRVRFHPNKPGCWTWLILAHEIGHALGSGFHAPLGTDIMSEDSIDKWNSDQTVAFNFVFNVAPLGWKVPPSSVVLMQKSTTKAFDFVALPGWNQ
jgi:hypothetical protein